ncbi:MAG: nicotinate-nucleotide adenylyltransferase [Anaerolineae bacterium]
MPADQLRRLGVYGGTFDPIHVGHLCIAEEARTALDLEQVLFIPARVSPLKQGQVSASAADRLEMVSLAIAGNPAFRDSSLEIDRPAPSFTVDTLRELHALYGSACELTLIIGGDSLATLTKWHQARLLPELARIAVYPRPGIQPDFTRLEQALPGLTAALSVLDAVQLDISSSAVRQRVRSGRSIRYLVPDNVAAFIQTRGLYLAETDTDPARNCPCT